MATNELGPWGGDNLGATALENQGFGADAGLPHETRFVGSVAKLVRRRLSASGADKDPVKPAIFLLQPTPPEHASVASAKRVPMLDNGSTPVAGRLWFVSAVGASGRYVDLGQTDDDGLISYVTDELNLGTVPTLWFDPRTDVPHARFYPKGFSDLERYVEISVTTVQVTLPEIFSAIDRIYDNMLVTPEAQSKAGKLWEDGSKFWASQYAEDTVQLYLRSGLTMAFPTCTVRQEQTSTPGRLDLEIEEADAVDRAKIVRHAVLELKVLRSFGSTGNTYTEATTLDWIKSGVQQAGAYRDERNALVAALCCFDMRSSNSGEKCFDHIVDLAEAKNVALKVWYLYSTSSAFRSATQTLSSNAH